MEGSREPRNLYDSGTSRTKQATLGYNFEVHYYMFALLIVIFYADTVLLYP